jgi:putative transport protein
LFLKDLLQNPVAVTMLVITVGLALGQIRLAGISLGSSGVLFAALICGAWIEVDLESVRTLGNFGVVLFVYAIGLQAGSRFFRTMKHQGWEPLVIGLSTVVVGAVSAGVLGYLLGLPREFSVGVFAGSLTSTPALAAAADAADSPLVAVAYGLAYPIGVIGVVLVAQLMPRWLSNGALSGKQSEQDAENDMIHQRCFIVQNPGCMGHSLAELALDEIVDVNISRVMRRGEVFATSGEFRLEKDDIILAVGTNHSLDRLTLLIGPPVPAEVELREVPNVVARDIVVTENRMTGRSLKALHLRSTYNVVITRVRRDSFEFVPRGDFVLEIGDMVRAVGYEPDVRQFAEIAGAQERRVHETGIPTFAAGLLIGLILGLMPINIPVLGEVRLGLAGGPLFAGLLFGHVGRIGKFRIYVPAAARFLMRELGLVLFLVATGLGAGQNALGVLESQGVALVITALLSVMVASAVGFGLARGLYGHSVARCLGLTCGAMTSTPGLGVASAQFTTDEPTLAYASVYPIALLAMTVVAQLMYFALPA